MKFLALLLLPLALFAKPATWFPEPSAYEQPWGRDAALAKKIECKEETSPTRSARVGVRLIRVHQKFVSPWDGPRSHHVPCSSRYTLEAMKKYGFFKGFCMGCSRLERENNDLWVYHTVEIDGATYKEDLP